MPPPRCASCGLVNFAAHQTCRRCGAALTASSAAEPVIPVINAQGVKPRSLSQRLIWISGVIITLTFVWSRSLLLTSDGLGPGQRPIILQAIQQLERAGFAKEVVALRHLANYRTSDSWWNDYLGHHDAYAATNFPFEVVTLYPPFFRVAADDTERAVILLHESQHLLGLGEEAALEGVWREKQRLGWTSDQYSQTKVWKNTREWTISSVPWLFQCGGDRRSDCAP